VERLLQWLVELGADNRIDDWKVRQRLHASIAEYQPATVRAPGAAIELE
jgi:hypothetical protein